MHLSITAMSFHSSANVLLAAGQDKHVRFFNVDGEKNDKLLSKLPKLTYLLSPNINFNR